MWIENASNFNEKKINFFCALFQENSDVNGKARMLYIITMLILLVGMSL